MAPTIVSTISDDDIDRHYSTTGVTFAERYGETVLKVMNEDGSVERFYNFSNVEWWSEP